MKLCECGCGQPTPLAPQTSKRRGWIKGIPLRFITHHNLRRDTAPDYIVDDNGCWIWQKKISNWGYGCKGVNGETILAHRWHYENKYGVIPHGMELDHLCNVRCCVNPDHCEPVTPAENYRRRQSNKLNRDTVEQIRAMAGRKQHIIAQQFGISQSQVSRVLRGENWG